MKTPSLIEPSILKREDGPGLQLVSQGFGGPRPVGEPPYGNADKQDRNTNDRFSPGLDTRFVPVG